MKTLVIYDSNFGNTEKVSQKVAEGVSAEAKKITDVNPERLEDFEMVIVGSPTHGGRPSQQMKSFLDKIPSNSLKGKKSACFDTSIPVEGQSLFLKMIIKIFGYAAKRTAAIMVKKGTQNIASESFFVLGKEGPLKEGELERAKDWAERL